MFTETEIAYLRTQRLGRIATTSKIGQPDVAPVVFDFDGTHFYVPGLELQRTLKFKNIQDNPRVAFVVDDLQSVDPWTPRGIRVHGTADAIPHRSRFGAGTYIRIIPRKKYVWGIDEPAIIDGKPNIKRQHTAARTSE